MITVEKQLDVCMVDDVMYSPERIQARSTWSKECTLPVGLDVDESADTKQAAWSSATAEEHTRRGSRV